LKALRREDLLQKKLKFFSRSVEEKRKVFDMTKQERSGDANPRVLDLPRLESSDSVVPK